MKTKNFFTLITILLISVSAFSANWEWKNIYGDVLQDNAVEVKTDNQNNHVIVGNFGHNINFGSTELIHQGEYESPSDTDWSDMFILKTNTAGEALWAVSIESADKDIIAGFDLDPNGNIYVTGSFQESGATFNSTNGESVSLSSIGYRDLFIAKYSSDGELLWAEHAGADFDMICYAYSHNIAVDDQGNAFITGQFWKQVVIGDNHLVAENYGDIFAAKYSPDGEVLWANKLNCSYHGRARQISLDNDGNVYIAGLFEEEHITFPDTTFYATAPEEVKTGKQSSNNYPQEQLFNYQEIKNIENKDKNKEEANPDKDIFIPIVEDCFLAKYNSDGEYVWARHISGTQDEQPWAIETDNLGNIYLGINWMDNITIGDFTYEAAMGGADITYYDFSIAKFNSDGIAEWVLQEAADTPYAWINDISVDNAGRIFAVGRFFSFATLGGELYLDGTNINGFVAAYNLNGEILDAINIQGSEYSNPSVSLSSISALHGNQIIAGNFSPDVILGDELHNSQGYNDFFISKISMETPFTSNSNSGPANLNTSLVDNYNVSISWDELPSIPGNSTELYYGEYSDLGTDDFSPFSLSVGYQHSEEVVVNQIKSYIRSTDEWNAQTIEFFLMGDNNGIPDPNNILGGPYTCELAAGIGVEDWLTVEFEDVTIAANEIFHVVQMYNSENNYAAGSTKNTPATLNSVYYIDQWYPFSAFGITEGIILRAVVSEMQEPSGYNIYRNGNMINNEPIVVNKNTNNSKAVVEYIDNKLLSGTYEYSASGLYGEYEQITETELSNTSIIEIIYPNYLDIKLDITTNSGDNTEGFLVELANTDPNNTAEYETLSSVDGEAYFSEIYTGWGEETFSLVISHPAFETFEVEFDGTTINADAAVDGVVDLGSFEMIESIEIPYNIEVATENLNPGNALLTWNNLYGAEDFSDSFEDASFDSWEEVIDGNGIPAYENEKAYWHIQEINSDYAPDGNHVAVTASGWEIDTWLISPEISLHDAKTLSFWWTMSYYWNAYENDSVLNVKISVDGGEWQPIWSETECGPFISWIWYETVIDLTPYYNNGENIRIAFNVVNDTETLTDVTALDNIIVSNDSRTKGTFAKTSSPDASIYAYSIEHRQNSNYDISNSIDKNTFSNISKDSSGGKATTNNVQRSFTGYNVYLDGVLLEEATENLEFTYNGLVPGQQYTAGVQSVYTSGVSEIVEKAFTVPNANLANFTVNNAVSGNPVEGAAITILENENVLETITTDNDGLADIEWYVGEYSYSVEIAGYQSHAGTFSIINENVTNTDISLEPYFNVVFVVQNEDEEIIDDATITFNETEAETGQYEFETIRGTYDFSVNREGYEVSDGSLTIVDESITEQVTLAYIRYEITFNVVDQNDEPIQSASIIVGDLDPANTDTDGSASVMMPNGVYEIVVTHPDYEDYTDDINVADGPTSLTIVMEKSSTGLENMDFTDLNIYPNPFVNTIKIENIKNVNHILISNIFGAVIKQIEVNGSNELTINASDLKSGTYMIMFINSNGKSVTRKLIKN